MTGLSGINQFNKLEPLMLSAKVEVSWLGTRSITLHLPKDRSVIQLKVTLSDFLAHIDNLQKQAGSKLSWSELNAGKKILTHLKGSILNKFDAEVKKNCWKRIIVAIREFFTCFFKNFYTNLKRIQTNFPPLPQFPFFEQSNHDAVTGTLIKSMLSPGSYGALTCTNQKLHRLLSTQKHFSFDTVDYRMRYNIKTGAKRSSSVSFTDLLGKSNYDVAYEQFKNRIAMADDDVKGHLHFGNTMRCLIQGDRLVTFLSDKLCITKMSGTPLGSATSLFSAVPKEAFFPPLKEDVAIDIFSQVDKLTESYFTLTFQDILSVWSSETGKCLYAISTERGVRETYMKNSNTLMILEGCEGTRSTRIYEINLTDVASSPQRYIIDASIVLPNTEPYSRNTIGELGFICCVGTEFYFYPWEEELFLIPYTLTVPTNRVQMYLDKNTIIIQESAWGDFAIRTVAMDIHTKQICPIQFYSSLSLLDVNHICLGDKLQILQDKFFVFKGYKGNFGDGETDIFLFVVDLKTGNLVKEIPVGDGGPYSSYYLTKKGDIVAGGGTEESPTITVYQALTGNVLMKAIVKGQLLLNNETLLVYYDEETKTATFIDPVTYRLIAHVSTERPVSFLKSGKMCFSNGKMLSVDRKAELVKIDDYYPQVATLPLPVSG